MSWEFFENAFPVPGMRRCAVLCQHPDMSTFDPETGVRMVPAAVATDAAPAIERRPRNPYDLALGVVWASLGALAVLLLLVAAGLQTTPTGGGGSLIASVVLAVLAVLVGSVHLGVRAIGWRPPED